MAFYKAWIHIHVHKLVELFLEITSNEKKVTEKAKFFKLGVDLYKIKFSHIMRQKSQVHVSIFINGFDYYAGTGGAAGSIHSWK